MTWSARACRRATSTTRRAAQGYAPLRRTDPRIAAYVHAALGDARRVVNVGAGAGSYEPEDRYVVAVEPSAAMRAQRPRHRRRDRRDGRAAPVRRRQLRRGDGHDHDPPVGGPATPACASCAASAAARS